ncbi:MAG TPA: alpha/beta fold hydrolase [Acidimicrobiales bacterium]|nr:alpha/beta fold hydrolase [Acidimicrobiales bacterium]
MLAHEQLRSGDSLLDLKISSAVARPVAAHVLVLVHGLPRLTGMGRQAAGLLPELAEHVASESGWTVATGTLSGVGGSTGTFSASQWRQDLGQILDRVAEGDQPISLAGFGFGGSLALAVAADDERVRGVATFAAPAHLQPWAGTAEDIHYAVQVAGVVGNERDLLAPDELYKDLLAVDPMRAIKKIPPRRLLIGHGTDDVEVPASDARDLVAAAEGRAELRLIQGAGHQLRADPRMVATLLGWLDRHR